VALAGAAKHKQSAARLAASGVLDNYCGSSCRRPDMLVMSLSPLLGQAIPDIAETTEIIVFPRRGARSGCFRVLKPHGEIQPPYPPRTPWGLWGGAVGRPWARSGSTFASTAWLFAAVSDQIRSFSANVCNFVRRGSVQDAICMYFLSILDQTPLKI